MPTRNNVVPGNWGSVQDGKWHLLSGGIPTSFSDKVASRCGLTFEPFNVTGGEAPPTNDHYICLHCARSVVV